MRNVIVAAIQMRCVPDPAENLRTAERLVRQAAEQGAQVILLPELFEREYFCQQRRYDFLRLCHADGRKSRRADGNPSGAGAAHCAAYQLL